MEYKIRKVVTDRFAMKYLSFGRGEKALVILPGLSVQSVIGLAPAIVNRYKRFADEFAVYVFDRRMDPPDDYDIFQMAKDTVDAFVRLGLAEISLFGTSQGGMIGMTIAAVYPRMISKLSVSSTAMKMDEKRFAVIREWIELADKKDRAGLYLSMAKRIYPADIFEQFRDGLAEISKTVTDEDLARFITFAKGMKGFDLTDKMAEIKCPVQVSYDEGDLAIVGEPAVELKKHLAACAGLELKSFNGYGHALYDTAPGFADWLYEFFSEATIQDI